METVSETPSVGVETASVESSPSPSESTSPYPSDDQILDGPDPVDAPTDGIEEITKVEAVAEGDTKPEVEAKPDEAKEEEHTGAEPEELKRAFKAHPELRQAYFGYDAYKQVFPSIQEAREVKSMFPTLDVAKQAQNDAVMLHQVDQLFTNNPEAFIQHAFEGDKDALLRMVEALPKALFNLDPETYTRTLGEKPVRAVFNNLTRQAQERLLENNEDVEAQDLKTAVEILNRVLFGDKPKAAPQARRDENDPVYREWRQMKQWQQQSANETYQRFTTDVGRGFKAELTKTVDAQIARLDLKGMPAGALKVAKEEILKAVEGDLRMRPYVNQLVVSQLRSGGQYDADHQAKVIEFIMGHANQVVPGKVKEVIDRWTGEILTSNQAQIARSKDVPKRPDVGASGGSPPAAKPEKINYRNPKHTDDYIMSLPD